MAELRSFIFLNRLQPQTMCYLGTWIRGSLPRSDVAALREEIRRIVIEELAGIVGGPRG